jgi:peptidoglycan hydrolase CwlO-like protein
MKKTTLAAVGFGLLALAACGQSDQDQLNTTEANEMESLDELSNDAANVAADAAALENQAAQLEQEAQATDGTGAETPADENIEGNVSLVRPSYQRPPVQSRRPFSCAPHRLPRGRWRAAPQFRRQRWSPFVSGRTDRPSF